MINLNNSHKQFLLLLFIVCLRQNPGIPLAQSKTSSQPQPPLLMDSRATTSRAAKPKGAGRAEQSVCHCDNLLKGGGQGTIEKPGLKS